MRRVAITGIGVVCPLGADTAAFWNNCLLGNAAVAPIPDEWKAYCSYSSTLWAPLPAIDLLRFRINRIEIMQSDMTALLAIAAADQALAMSGVRLTLCNEKKNSYTLNAIDPLRCGVFMGTGIGGIASFAANQGHQLYAPLRAAIKGACAGVLPSEAANAAGRRMDGLLRYPPRFHPFAVAMSMPNTAAAAVGNKYSLHGPNQVYCNACAAGLTAIGRGFSAIRDGEADWALAGGVEYLHDDYGGVFRGFDAAKTLVSAGNDPLTANRPFDKKRSGFLLAEGGAAVLVLETFEHALARGAIPIAEICSFAETFDAFNMMSPDPSGKHIERMVRMALEKAGLPSKDIDYINAHGTATMVNDEIEANIIERIFGNGPLVNATKSLTGHAIGASGAIEAAVTALSLKHQATHACKNLFDPIRPLRFVREAGPFNLRNALTQSFAFGGHNAALVLARWGAS